MTKISLIGLAMISIIAVILAFKPELCDVLAPVVGGITAITGVHSIGRGFEDGMTKFKGVATKEAANGDKKTTLP
jgi:hypothetical protein